VGSTSNTLCEGEIMQVANRDNFELTEAEYLDIITRKTAALVATSCELGAQYGGADPATVQRFRRYGECCGIAFQIVDDLLDITGSEADTGKSLGRDVQKGKLTLALIHYLANEPADARTRMLAHLRSEDPQRHRQAATLLQESESLHYAQSAAEHYVAEARASLADLPHSPAKDSLLTLAEFILSRRH
jgi:octaprenyl-diphosphate synthase